MTCNECIECTAPKGYVCKNSGNIYSTGEYIRTIDFFNMIGASFEQKIGNVSHLLDYNTIQILKLLIADELPYAEGLEVISILDKIQSRLSNDNNSQNTTNSDKFLFPWGD